MFSGERVAEEYQNDAFSQTATASRSNTAPFHVTECEYTKGSELWRTY
ncbi:hypothetical protein TIFTF001_020740 [Ficus carica]|uniref:Uncharacterized protein n=1 Tax=Ficus carica TaxID=3494 RepID=A0AA88AGN7_FICCA|nr:hypothetical protein TIFTF001_020740 [Ficus carica]